MKKDEIILEGLGDSIGNEFTDLINIRVADIAFPARKTGYINARKFIKLIIFRRKSFIKDISGEQNFRKK